MDNRWMLSDWISHIILVGALVMLLVAEVTVVAATLGWPNGNVVLGTRGIGQLLVNEFLTLIPFVVGIWGCMVVKRLQSKFDAEREKATFVWLWRQYLAGTVFAYAAIISVVMSVAGAFRSR